MLLDDYLRGVIDVTWSGLHLRYLVDSEYVPTGPLSDPELELFAKDFAYRTNLDAVTRVWGYRVDATYDDNQTGFDAYGFVRGDSPPVLAIRGTEPNTIQDVLADLNPLGVGFNQFDANRTAVVNWLNTAAAASGKAPIITGHSLGGALVQLMASYYTQQAATNLLTTVVTFNSAGVSTPWVVGYKPNQVAGGTRHYVVAGDIVSMAGNGFLPGSYQAVYQSYPSFLDQVNPLNKHTKPILVAMIGDNLKPTTAIVAHPNVNWLNSPWFCYDVPEHYALIAALTVAAAPLGLANLPPVLVFRGSSEATRVNLGSDLQQILNQIEFADDGAVLSFTVTVPKIDITLFGFAVLRLDNIQVRYQANPQPLLYMQGRVILPGFGGLGADFTGANYIRITGTGLELQGSLTNGFLPLVNDWFFNQLNVSFDQPNQKLTASGVMAFGPFDTVKLPIYLGGGTLSGRLVTANFNGMITPTAVMGTSNVSVFGGWAQGGTVSLNVDLVNQALTLDGSMSFLSGGVVATATITGDTSFNIMASGEATVIYPFSPFTGTTLGSGQFIFKYSHNNTLADDFVEGTGTNLGVTIGVRVYLNGRVVPIGRISLFAAPETSSVADDPQPTLALSRKETPRLDSEKDLALAAAFGDARLDSARTGRRSPALRRLAVLDEAFALAAVEDFPEQY